MTNERSGKNKNGFICENLQTKSKKKKNKDDNAPKRASTAFMLWLNETREQIKRENPNITVTEIAKKGGEMWRELKDKSKWEEKAAKDKERYQAEMKNYKPSSDGGDDGGSGSKKRKKESSSPKKPTTTMAGAGFKSKEYISEDDSSSGSESDKKKKKKVRPITPFPLELFSLFKKFTALN